MKNLIKYFSFLLILLTGIISLPSCQEDPVDQRLACEEEILDLDESALVAEYLEKRGDPVNCEQSCTIDAKEVYANLDANYYIIDIRSKNNFTAGHIEGAINLPMRKLYYHFKEKLEPFKYDKIVLCCYSGQSASYATSLLRMLGYNNVHALKYGMSSWNSELSSRWMSKLKPTNELNLSSLVPMAVDSIYDFPTIETGKVWREDIVAVRVEDLLRRGSKLASLKSEVLDKKEDAFIIAYGDENFKKGNQVTGANYFEMGESLKRSEKLQNIPLNQEIIVYSANGFESAYAVAYLRLLGYDAKTVSYGVNTFKKQNSGDGFSVNDVHNYPLEKATSGQIIVVQEDAGGC